MCSNSGHLVHAIELSLSDLGVTVCMHVMSADYTIDIRLKDIIPKYGKC